MYSAEEWLVAMRIMITKLTPVLLCLATACSGFPYLGSKVSENGKTGPSEDGIQGVQGGPQAVLELQNVQYDRGVLSGRLLVGALVDGLRLDKRLISGIHVNADSVRDCNADQEVSYVIVDFFVPAAREEDLLILNRGYWYGGEARLRLFFDPGPECINVELSLLSFEGRRIGSARVRAEHVPLQAMDAGTPEERKPVDGGVP
jgi:hypothetical protein